MSYQANEANKAQATDVAVVTGVSTDSVIGRTVLVYDSLNVPVACGIVVPTHLISATFVPVAGPLKVQGWVSVTAGGAAQKSTMALEWHLSDVDPGCTYGPQGAPNSCGVRIYKSTDCAKQLTPMDHLFNVGTLMEDPWSTVAYTAYSSTAATTTPVTILTGITTAEALGKAVGIHDADGDLVACALLEIGGFSGGFIR